MGKGDMNGAARKTEEKKKGSTSFQQITSIHRLIVAYKRRSLLILKANPSTPGLGGKSIHALDDPEKRDNGKRKRGPMHERIARLVRKDGPKRPRNRDASGEVTLRGRECVGGSCGFEEEESNEYEDFGPDASGGFQRIYAECLEEGNDD